MKRLKTELVTPIAEVLAEFDLMNLREGNPDIVDEYRPEAEDITKRLERARRKAEPVSVADVSALLASVFEHWFEVKCEAAELEAPARRIHELLSSRVGEGPGR